MDLMRPGLPGEEVLPRIKGIPTIVMSAKADIDTKVKLLYEGACDYITKPFVVSELLARCAVHLRMHAGAKNASEAPADPLIRAGGVALDPELMIAYIKDEEIALTRTEAAILQNLMLIHERPLGSWKKKDWNIRSWMTSWQMCMRNSVGDRLPLQKC